MALINCPECSAEVSDSAFKCPKCSYQIKKPKRGCLGVIFKWTFILFNVLMLVWLISYFLQIGELSSELSGDAEKAGAAIGATMGTGMLLSIWAIGDVILGLFVLFTRPKG